MGELADGLELGPITLAVADLGEMTRFYRDGVGLEVLGESLSEVSLGYAGAGAPVEVVKLTLQPDLKPENGAAAGLYHLAILFPTQAALAVAINSVAQKFPANFSGSADHLVSEAFYFNDPEGNGVELYWDRPKSEWPRLGEYIRMDTLPLDPNTFLREHLQASDGTAVNESVSGLSRGRVGALASSPVKLGHLHLRVGNLAQAEDFYVNKVGFDKTFQFGSQALFVSAGGYHHHLGMNTWQSAGAGPRNHSRGLAEFEILLPSGSDVANLRERLKGFGVPAEPATPAEQAFTFFDPWRNRIRVTAQKA